VWDTVRSRNGWLGLLVCLLPLGCATANSLWAAVASEWHAGADTVALVTGMLAAGVTAAGCVVGGWVSDRVSPRYFYLAVALTSALSLVGMAYAPRTEALFIGGTLLYALINGMATASYVTLILEAIGKGAAATKYTLFASVGNMPSYLMLFVLGYAHTHFGSVGMLNTEFVFAVGSLVVYLVVQRVFVRGHVPGWRKQVAAPEPLQAALLAG
jgi:MFS-type transporter involved in bile tolerance (Atg22 family)